MERLDPVYYVLECYSTNAKPTREVKAFPRVNGIRSWFTGQRFRAKVPSPLIIDLLEEPDLDPPVMIYSNMLIWRDDLVQAMREAGADNFDAFPVLLRDGSRGKSWDHYFAINIIGLVSAAKLERSQHHYEGAVPLIDVDFNSLTIDDDRASGLKLFRLAEAVNAILIHESVRNHLLEKDFTELTIIDPKEWVG